jgi:hypothetical protein
MHRFAARLSRSAQSNKLTNGPVAGLLLEFPPRGVEEVFA